MTYFLIIFLETQFVMIFNQYSINYFSHRSIIPPRPQLTKAASMPETQLDHSEITSSRSYSIPTSVLEVNNTKGLATSELRTALETNVVQSESNIEYDHDNSSNIVQSESTKHSQEENSLPSDANDVAVEPIYETVADMKPPVIVDEDSAHDQQEQGISHNVNINVKWL